MFYLNISLIIVLACLVLYIFALLLKIKKLEEKICIQTGIPHKAEGKREIYLKLDKNFRITYINEYVREALRFSPNDLIGKNAFGTIFEVNTGAEAAIKVNFQHVLETKAPSTKEYMLQNAKGDLKLFKCQQSAILNEQMSSVGLTVLCSDINEQKHSSNIDPITNVLSSQKFMQRFEHDFKLAMRYNQPFALINIELSDILKFINKAMGYETGDKLLRKVSETCIKYSPEQASVGRFENSQIGVMLPGMTEKDAKILSELLYEKITTKIKRLGIDSTNAEMIIVGYDSRNSVNDTSDILFARLERTILRARREKNFRVIS